MPNQFALNNKTGMLKLFWVIEIYLLYCNY
jgi:hypothetical protein